MSPPTIEVVVRPDGSLSVRTTGFPGPACLEAARFLEGSLGTIVDRRATAEFYQTQPLEEHESG